MSACYDIIIMNYHAKERVGTPDGGNTEDPAYVKFHCSVDDQTMQQVYTYNKFLSFIEEDTPGGFWNFHRTLKHEGPLRNTNPRY